MVVLKPAGSESYSPPMELAILQQERGRNSQVKDRRVQDRAWPFPDKKSHGCGLPRSRWQTAELLWRMEAR